MKALKFEATAAAGGSSSIRLPFARAIEEAVRRKVELPVDYYGQAISVARSTSFTVSGLASLDQIDHVLKSLNKNLADGGTFADWKKSLSDADIRLPDHRLDLIFRNHMQTAFNRGRCQNHRRHANARPYLLYSAINDSRTRPAHHAMDGFIAHINDPIWQQWMPQNGHNCRCSVISLTEKAAAARGISTAYPTAKPDKGWDYNPCSDPAEGAERAVEAKAGTLPPVFNGVPDALAKGASQRVRPSVPELLAVGGKEVNDLLVEAARLGDGELLWQSFRTVLIGKLQKEKKAGTTKLKIDAGARGKAGKLFSDAAKVFPASWIERANNLGALHVRAVNSRAYSYTVGADGAPSVIRLSDFGIVRNAKAGDGFMTARDFSSAVHELTHRLQYALPDLDDFFQEAHALRTSGDALQRLRDITGSNRFRTHEVARPDKYVNAYQGREYRQGSGTSYVGRAGALEVMTMAMEWVLGGNSAMLAKLAADDVEMLHLTVALLLHFEP